MNTKMILVWVVLVLVVVSGVYFFSQTTPLSPSNLATTTQTAIGTSTFSFPSNGTASTSTSTTTHRGPKIENVETRIIVVDERSLVSTSTYPTIRGISNLSTIGMIIYNSEHVGIVGSSAIPVAVGRWSYTAPIALTKGTYTIQMIGAGGLEVTKTLTIQ